jgi:GT2 family glycosyltransferase
MEENLGYGSSHNIAIKSMFGVSRYHLVLNPDVYFSPEVLQKLLNKMRSDAQIGLLMPKVISQDGNLQLLCRTLPCPLELIARRFTSNLKSHHFFKKNDLSISSYDQQMNVPFLSGCFMFLSLDALLKVGVFDERFFMYAEDLDLSRRLHAEFKTIYYPSVSITHIHARDSYKNIRMMVVHALSMIRYFNKWGWFNDSERNAMNAKFLKTFS